MRFDRKLLTRLRVERGLSKYRLAKDAGVDRVTVHRLENGEMGDVWGQRLISISQCLGVDPRIFYIPTKKGPS